MKRFYSLFVGLALTLAVPLAPAAGNTEPSGIEASTTSNAYWYAGTSGVSPN